jgi:hypothetical protein
VITLCIALFATLTSTEPTQRACFVVPDVTYPAVMCSRDEECEVVSWWVPATGEYVVQLEYVLPPR